MCPSRGAISHQGHFALRYQHLSPHAITLTSTNNLQILTVKLLDACVPVHVHVRVPHNTLRAYVSLWISPLRILPRLPRFPTLPHNKLILLIRLICIGVLQSPLPLLALKVPLALCRRGLSLSIREVTLLLVLLTTSSISPLLVSTYATNNPFILLVHNYFYICSFLLFILILTF